MSLLKELAKLSQPAPSLPDLEDINNEGNNVNTNKFDEDDNEVPQRRKIFALPAFQDDEKYGGKKVLRCDIFDESIITDDDADILNDRNFEDIEDDKLHAEIGSAEDLDEEEEVENEDNAASTVEDEDEDEKIPEELESYDEEEMSEKMEDEEKEGSATDEDNQLEATTNDMKNIMVTVDKEKESKKADSVRQQLKQWDALLFLKIKLQAAVRAYNQLPRGRLAKELLKDCDESTRTNMEQARKNAKELVELLLSAEKTLLASSSLTQSIVGIEGGMGDSDDEEIESSEDEADVDDDIEGEDDLQNEEEEEEEEEESNAKQQDSAGHSWKALEKRLKENESNFDKFRSTTLIKWDERTKLTGIRRAKDAKKDFTAFEKGNVVQQIEKTVSDKARILSRTQKKRGDNERIGGDPEADFDAEIFDDDDFYEVLLKEVLDKKTNSTSDPIEMTRNFIEMQNLRNKRSKKKVFDNKLSKDRKLKYVKIPKLVNFHPARPELIKWTHETRNELFKSLFK